jgi:tetratricopeptide (TPR) repeat protein
VNPDERARDRRSGFDADPHPDDPNPDDPLAPATVDRWRYVDPADDRALADLVDESQVRPADVDAAALVDVGLSYVGIEAYELAVDAFVRAARYAGDDGLRAEAYANAGVAHARLGEYDAAVGAAREALSLDPTDDVAAVAHANVAYALWEAGDSSRPLAHAERAVELDPRLAEAWYDLGFLYNERGLWEFAREALATASRLGLRTVAVASEYERAVDGLAEAEAAVEAAAVVADARERDAVASDAATTDRPRERDTR